MILQIKSTYNKLFGRWKKLDVQKKCPGCHIDSTFLYQNQKVKIVKIDRNNYQQCHGNFRKKVL